MTVLASGLKLYEGVAQRLAQAIEAGTFAPGDRLPSVRELSTKERVSVSTVLQAFLLLEDRGLVEPRAKSGHYVRASEARRFPEPSLPLETPTPAPVEVGALVSRVYRAALDERLVPLGAAVPSPSLLPVRRLSRIAAALVRADPQGALRYAPPPGLPVFRQQVARRSLAWGCRLSPEQVIVTCGAAEAVSLALMAVARPGDKVAVASPAYYGTLQTLEAQGLKAVEVPSHPRSGMDLDALRRVLVRHRLAAVLDVPNFSNPLGSLMPDEHKERLVEMLASRDVPLIEDDVYGDLHFGSRRPWAAKAFDRRGLVLLCGSFSKTLAPGFRVGWVAPGKFRERVELLKFAQTIAAPTLQQLTLAEFLASGAYERCLRPLRRALESQVRRVSLALTESFPEGTCVTRPEGGAVVWLKLPAGGSALTLHARALEAGISITPGPLFSARSERYADFVRISCGEPWSRSIEAAIDTLGRLAGELRVARGRGALSRGSSRASTSVSPGVTQRRTHE